LMLVQIALHLLQRLSRSIWWVKKRSSFYDTKFNEFLKVAFKQPRKKLIKNLSLKYTKEHLQNIFEKMNIDKILELIRLRYLFIRDYIKN